MTMEINGVKQVGQKLKQIKMIVAGKSLLVDRLLAADCNAATHANCEMDGGGLLSIFLNYFLIFIYFIHFCSYNYPQSP